MSFFEELKRRNVVRVGIAYAVAAWIILQLTDVIGEIMELPAWGGKLILLMVVVGFVIALFLAWAFELTPEGIKRESEVNRDASITPQTGRKLDRMIIGLLVLALAYFVWESRFMERRTVEPESTGEAIALTADSETEPAAPAPATRSLTAIAVLPFLNMSDDVQQDYFSDGISEELLNLLAQVDELDVASRTSSFAYKGSSKSIPEIAEELRVGTVLEGSVRKAGNQVRITAQLIDTNNDRHLWSDSFDRDLVDIFQVQDEIASAIVDALKTELGLDIATSEIQVAAATDDMDAYDLYLQGRELALARSDLFRALQLLEEAVERDPEFTRAWSMLGMTAFLTISWNRLGDEARTASLERSREAIDRALELDENQALPWAILAMIGTSNDGARSYGESIALLNKAIELDPDNATAWLWRGIRYSEAGYIEEAIADIRQCLEVDPAYQNCRRHLAVNQWMVGDNEGAIENYTSVARSGFSLSDSIYLPIFFSLDQELAGLVTLSLFGAAHPGFPTEAVADAFMYPERDHSRNIPLVESWLENAESLPTAIAQILYLTFRAYDQLESAPESANSYLWYPGQDQFRRSPHFQRVVRDMNLPAYWAERGLPAQCEEHRGEYRCTSPAEKRAEGPDQEPRRGDGT